MMTADEYMDTEASKCYGLDIRVANVHVLNVWPLAHGLLRDVWIGGGVGYNIISKLNHWQLQRSMGN